RQDFVDHYTAQGDRLLQGGVEPGIAPAEYIAAYPGLCAFVRQHGDALAERGVVSAEIEAGQGLVQRLCDLHVQGLLPEDSPVYREIIAPACGKLLQVRDGVRRMARGRDGAELRSQFGLTYVVEQTSAASVLHGIGLFLQGAENHPAHLRTFRLLPS